MGACATFTDVKKPDALDCLMDLVLVARDDDARLMLWRPDEKHPWAHVPGDTVLAEAVDGSGERAWRWVASAPLGRDRAHLWVCYALLGEESGVRDVFPEAGREILRDFTSERSKNVATAVEAIIVAPKFSVVLRKSTMKPKAAQRRLKEWDRLTPEERDVKLRPAIRGLSEDSIERAPESRVGLLGRGV